MLTTYITRYQPIIEASIKDYCQRPDFLSLQPDLRDAISYSLLGNGKRIRPLLSLASFQLFSPDSNDPILPFCAAIEMIHTYSLIHDDLPAMDNDDFRRGQLTCHKKFGDDIAILAGDTLNTWAFEILSQDLKSHFTPDSILSTLYLLAQKAGYHGMIGGQAMDIKSPLQSGSLDYLQTMHQKKTGALIQASICGPALLVQASQDTLSKLTLFSEKLGLLFQITDDILDCTQSQEVLGKSPHKDSKQGKLTYVSAHSLSEAKIMAKSTQDHAISILHSLEYSTDILIEFVNYVFSRRS